MKAKIFKSVDGQWYCILVSRNGQIVFTSETYTQKKSVTKMLKRNFPNIPVVK